VKSDGFPFRIRDPFSKGADMFSRGCVLTFVVAVFVLFAVMDVGCSKVSREDREFKKLAEGFIEDYFRMHPVSATWIGEHRYDSTLDDLSEKARLEELGILKDYLEKLRRIDKSKLSLDNRIDAEILENELKKEIFTIEKLKEWRNNPLLYTQLIGNSIYLLMARDFAPAEERVTNAISRLKAFPNLVEQAMENLSNPPRVHTETAIKQNRGNIALCDKTLREFAKSAGKDDEEFEKALSTALDALRKFQDFLEKELYFKSNGDFRLGRDLFEKKLALTLQAQMSVDEIVEKARAEMERLHDEMFRLAYPIYLESHPDDKLDDATPEKKKEVIRFVLDEIARDHPRPEGLLDACRAAYEEAKGFVEERDLITLPKEPLEIIWAPEFSRGVAVAGLRAPGPLDREMKSFYVVSPVPEDWSNEQVESYLREYNNEMIRVLTIHEAMPGHYVQLAYSNRCPSLIRAVFSSGTFVEGWAVYTERMMLEEGFRNQDPRLWLQRKKFYLRAVINSILDAGVHAGDMSQYQAMKLMVEDGFQEESEAAGKWRRACLTSTQLSTYFIGYNEVLELREEAKNRWGRKFSLKKFHEELLAHGSPAARYLREFLFEK